MTTYPSLSGALKTHLQRLVLFTAGPEIPRFVSLHDCELLVLTLNTGLSSSRTYPSSTTNSSSSTSHAYAKPPNSGLEWVRLAKLSHCTSTIYYPYAYANSTASSRICRVHAQPLCTVSRALTVTCASPAPTYRIYAPASHSTCTFYASTCCSHAIVSDSATSTLPAAVHATTTSGLQGSSSRRGIYSQ